MFQKRLCIKDSSETVDEEARWYKISADVFFPEIKYTLETILCNVF